MKKKKLLASFVVAGIAAVAALNVGMNAQSDKLSDMQLANAEALSSETDSGDNEVTCWSAGHELKGHWFYNCRTCSLETDSTWDGPSSKCK